MNFAKVRAHHSHLQFMYVDLREASIYIKGTPFDDLIKSIRLLSSRGVLHTAGGVAGQCKAWNPLSKQCFSWLDRSNNTGAG